MTALSEIGRLPARQRQAMIGTALDGRGRAEVAGVPAEQRFDACICMFAALGYQLSNADVQSTLANVRNVISPSSSTPVHNAKLHHAPSHP